MIGFILAILLVLVGIGLMVIRPGGIHRLIGLVPIALGVVFLFFSMTYTVDQGQAALVTGVGGAPVSDQAVTDPGIHVKAPWQNTVEFNVRNQLVQFVGDGSEKDVNGDGKADKVNGAKITAASRDNAQVYYDLAFGYSIDPTYLAKIYYDFKDQQGLEVKTLITGARSAAQKGPTTFPVAIIQQSRTQLQSTIGDDLKARLGAYGVTIEYVDVRNMDFDQVVKDKLALVPAAASEAEAARTQLDTARQQAERVKIEAKAQSDADQILRCGATTAVEKREVNGKQEDVTVVTGVPNEQCQNRLNEQVLTSKYIEMLRDAAAKGNTIYVIPPGTNNLLQLPAQAPKAP